ncbi:MAG: NUDIX hydrolase [Oscillochloris sp.]|nr:NUDIX hydrolase [Oscillochloris sp.]
MGQIGDGWAEDAHHYFRTPGKRMATAALFYDTGGRILIAKPVYRAEWLLPGGSVEENESPYAACVREVAEELGRELPVGRLLSIEYLPARTRSRPESVKMIFDGGILDDDTFTSLAPQPKEIAELRLLAAQKADPLLAPRIRSRVTAALLALKRGTTAYLEDGRVVVA